MGEESGVVRVRFLSEEDEVKGFYLLATQAGLRGSRLMTAATKS